MDETSPHQKRFPPDTSPVGILVYNAWEEQKRIRWSQLFKGRLSTKWGAAQDIYYTTHPDIKDNNSFSGQIWASKLIKGLIEIALNLRDAWNKILHGETPKEERLIQRTGAIEVATS